MPWKQIREISFAGCGVLNFYQAGVCERLLEEIPFDNVVFRRRVSGCGHVHRSGSWDSPRAVVDSVMRELGQHPVGAKLRPAWAQAIGEGFIRDFLKPGDAQKIKWPGHHFDFQSSADIESPGDGVSG